MADTTWEYVLVVPEHGLVGLGPTSDLRAVEQDQEAWLEDTGKHGTIMRRRVNDWEDVPATGDDPDPADCILAAERAVAAAEVGLVLAVAAARHRGWSWARIGAVLGVSRQAVWERFHHHQGMP